MKILKAMLLGMVLATGSVAAVSAYAVNKEPAIQVLPTVNINQANAAELSEALQGVGISRANAIVVYRQSKGPFKSADDLANVKGIGAATVKRNKDRITLK
ncbi:MAG: helix-hairpin-helix domain-containing protein [Alcanivoracaceae bacterium]|nr:helix-hairpin-helix domain-containing protein [Alcanivoracaceae bacterium]